MSRPLTEKEKKEALKKKLKATAVGAAMIYGGKKALDYGAPRSLGLDIGTHVTAKKVAKKIKEKSDIFGSRFNLDPNAGGSGFSKLTPDYVENSKKYMHFHLYHPKAHKKFGRFFTGLINKPVRALYRGLAGLRDEDVSKLIKNKDNFADSENRKVIGKALFKGLNPFANRGKTLFIASSPQNTAKKFIPDTDDLASKLGEKITARSNKYSAMADAVKREGLGKLMSQNNNLRRVAGVAGLATAGYLGYKGAKKIKDAWLPKKKKKLKKGKLEA